MLLIDRLGIPCYIIHTSNSSLSSKVMEKYNRHELKYFNSMHCELH